MQLEGTEHIVGIPYDVVPGNSLGDKYANLGELGVSDFLQNVKEFDFYVEMVPDKACFSPR